MKRIRCCLLIGAIWFGAGTGRADGPQGSDTLTLQQAIQLAVERNPAVRVSQAQLDELRGKIREVRAGAFPEVRADGYGLRLRDPSLLNSPNFEKLREQFPPPPGQTGDIFAPIPSNLFDYGVGLRQTLYSAGKVGNGIRLAQEGEQEKTDNLEAARQGVALRVFEAVHDYLLAVENLKVVQETREQRKKQLELAKSRFQLGVATEIDVLRSEVNLANTEPELIRAENRIRIARAGINNLIVRDLDSPTQIAGRLEYKPWAVPLQEVLQKEAMERRPEVQSARHVVAEMRLLNTLAHAENKLNVDLDTRLGINARRPADLVDSDFMRWNFTISFKRVFYDGGRKAGLIGQAEARLRAAEHSLAQLENDVMLEIKAAYDVLQSSAEAIAAARLNVKQAEKVLDMMQSNYKYGAATTLDVSDSQTSLTLARNNELLATYAYEVAKARLRRAAGRPLLDEEDEH